MYHVLTITYSARNLFSGKMENHRKAYRLSWSGVKTCLASSFYREHNASFRLFPYMGQKVDN